MLSHKLGRSNKCFAISHYGLNITLYLVLILNQEIDETFNRLDDVTKAYSLLFSYKIVENEEN